MINALSSFAPLVDASTAPTGPMDKKRTAVEFEVLLVKQMLDEMPMPGLDDTEAGTFLSLIHEALARQLVGQGGLGLVGQLDGSAEGPAHAPERPPEAAHPRTSSGFGWRHDPFDGSLRMHDGVDLPAPQGTPIAAVLPGVVSFAGRTQGYGNLVVVDHGDGLQTAYAHCASLSVQEGDAVDAGTRVGEVGSTGRSTGPHLHFEVRRSGQPVDPVLAGISPSAALALSSVAELSGATSGGETTVSSRP